MRTYTIEVNDNGKRYLGSIETSSRIRETVVQLFRALFRAYPPEHYHRDGMMAEGWDKAGRSVFLEQINHDLATQRHTLDPQLFKLFALIGGKLVPYIPPTHQLAFPSADVVCGWCGILLRPRVFGLAKTSHGICADCAAVMQSGLDHDCADARKEMA